MEKKIEKLKDVIRELGSVVVAYSGGIDSTFLAKVSYDVLGDKALAVTGHSAVNSSLDLADAKKYAIEIGIKHLIIQTKEVNNSDFYKNDKNRCFHCKTELFSRCLNIAKESGYAYVVEGSNFDDLNDYRPGMKASCDLNIKQPIVLSEITKKEIRVYLQSQGYSIWDKPASPCLSSRIPYGKVITRDKLIMVEKGELFLRSIGFYNMRVRHHDKIARIEVDPEDFDKITGNRGDILSQFNTIGFDYVTLDLQGFRTGSMNEVINTGGT